MEILDIYDDNGNVTDKTVIRGEFKLKENEHVKSCHVVIENQNGLYLIQQRSANKKTRPSEWDITCGAVSTGENSVTSSAREVKEEVGLDIPKDRYKFLGQTMSISGVFQDIYHVKHTFLPEDCVLQEEEVSDIKMLTKQEFTDFISNIRHRTDDYKAIILNFLKTKKD